MAINQKTPILKWCKWNKFIVFKLVDIFQKYLSFFNQIHKNIFHLLLLGVSKTHVEFMYVKQVALERASAAALICRALFSNSFDSSLDFSSDFLGVLDLNSSLLKDISSESGVLAFC